MESSISAGGIPLGDWPVSHGTSEGMGEKAPSLPDLMQARIQDQALLFKGSRHLTDSSKLKALKVSNLGAMDANDVYITHWGKSKIPDVVFKPGHEAAVKAKLGTELISKVEGLKHTVVPSKAGTVKMVIPRKSYKHPVLGYEKVLDGKGVALKGKWEPISKIKENDGRLLAKVGSKQVELIPTDRENVYQLKTLKNPLDQILKDQSRDFVFLETDDEEDEGAQRLALKEHVLNVFEHREKEYVRIHEQPYLIVEEKDGSLHLEKVETAKKEVEGEKEKEKETREESEAEGWISQKFVRCSKPIEAQGMDDEEEEDWDEVIVPQDSLFEATLGFDDELDYEYLEFSGEQYDYQKDGETIEVSPKQMEDDLIILNPEKRVFRRVLPITESGGDQYVTKGETKYLVTEDVSQVKLIKVEENVEGMVQLKVQDICTKVKIQISEGKEETKVVDVLRDDAFRSQFYERIDMNSYIDAFLSTILLRPQDGKMLNLPNSNYLFRIIPDSKGDVDPLNPNLKLEIVLIDLDEIMPKANDVYYMKDQGNKAVHPVRNGLMGFPHARKPLTVSEQQHAFEIMDDIISKKKEMHDYLTKTYLKKESKLDKKKLGILSDQHIQSFDQVITRLEEFKKNHGDSFTLEQLFFYVFPEYRDQWQRIGERETPEYKALLIGDDSIENIEKMLVARGK